MQWERAKNFMIIFFLLANILLAVLIRYEAGSYTLSREREYAIMTVFAQNDINMYYSIPRQFDPMRALRVAGHDYDIYRLLSIFFPSYAEISHESETDWDEFTWENTRLIISRGYVFFISGLGATGVPDKDAAINLTQDFIAEHFPDFKLDMHSTRQARRGGLRLFYRQDYQGYIIHTNFVEILVTGDGEDLVIEEVDIHYVRPVGFAYLPREIAGPDEALLTFLQHYRLHNDGPVLITHMDIVYFQPANDLLYIEPHYRLFIEGQYEPFLINAYTNRIRAI